MKPIPEATEFSPAEAAPDFSDALIEAITALKARLVARYERHFPRQSTGIRSAIEVAEAVAWCTPFPHLFLPELAEQQIALLISDAENSPFALAA